MVSVLFLNKGSKITKAGSEQTPWRTLASKSSILESEPWIPTATSTLEDTAHILRLEKVHSMSLFVFRIMDFYSQILWPGLRKTDNISFLSLSVFFSLFLIWCYFYFYFKCDWAVALGRSSDIHTVTDFSVVGGFRYPHDNGCFWCRTPFRDIGKGKGKSAISPPLCQRVTSLQVNRKYLCKNKKS